ncbi:MAG: hypothetical protein LBV27_05090, partial [Oscillospiraceae bacterium]|nr:hypothetical protein [Oscillospiraceae bacterium]
MQKSKLWAIMSVLLALAIVVCGCSQSQGTSSEAASSAASSGTSSTEAASGGSTAEMADAPLPAELTMFIGSALSGPSPASDTPVGKKIEEITGVK